MNRIVAFGVLVFSYALVMLGFQPSEQPVSFTFNIPKFPVWWYRGWGIAAIVISLAFLIMAIRTRWSEKAETWLANRGVYSVWLVIFEGMYILSFLKGFGEVVKASPPAWIVYTAFFFGYALAIYIPVIAFKYFPRRR